MFTQIFLLCTRKANENADSESSADDEFGTENKDEKEIGVPYDQNIQLGYK